MGHAGQHVPSIEHGERGNIRISGSASCLSFSLALRSTQSRRSHELKIMAGAKLGKVSLGVQASEHFDVSARKG